MIYLLINSSDESNWTKKHKDTPKYMKYIWNLFDDGF